MIGDHKAREKIVRMKVRDRIDSDHHPVDIWIEGGRVGKGRVRGKNCWREVWDEEGRESFKQKLEGMVEMGEE